MPVIAKDKKKPAAVANKKKQESSDDESSEEEVKKPVAKKGAAAKKVESSDDESDSEDAAPVKKAPVAAKGKAAKKQESSDEEDSDESFKGDKKVVAKKADSDMEEDSSDEDAKPVRKLSRVSEKSAGSKASKKSAGKKAAQEEDEDEGPDADKKELFVGNISYQATEDELYNHFAQWGEVTNVKIPTDRESGRSRGMAFVEFATHKEAAAACENTNGQDYNGRALRVNFSGDSLVNRPTRVN